MNCAFVGPFFVGSAVLARDVFGGPLVDVSLAGLFTGAGALVPVLTLYVAMRTSLSRLD